MICWKNWRKSRFSEVLEQKLRIQTFSAKRTVHAPLRLPPILEMGAIHVVVVIHAMVVIHVMAAAAAMIASVEKEARPVMAVAEYAAVETIASVRRKVPGVIASSVSSDGCKALG